MGRWPKSAHQIYRNDYKDTTMGIEYAKRRNLNRGYMKLETWQRGTELFVLAFQPSEIVGDFKLKSQFRDAAQSVAANIAESYGRRSLPESIQFLYIAKGSLGESLSHAIGLKMVNLISVEGFERFAQLHYEVENKLLRLIESLETKKQANDRHDVLPHQSTNPIIQQSSNP
jgi:four helix bundle protein